MINCAESEATNKWQIGFMVTGFDNETIASAPFWLEKHNETIADAFTKIYKTHANSKINISVTKFYEDDGANSVN